MVVQARQFNNPGQSWSSFQILTENGDTEASRVQSRPFKKIQWATNKTNLLPPTQAEIYVQLNN